MPIPAGRAHRRALSNGHQPWPRERNPLVWAWISFAPMALPTRVVGSISNGICLEFGKTYGKAHAIVSRMNDLPNQNYNVRSCRSPVREFCFSIVFTGAGLVVKVLFCSVKYFTSSIFFNFHTISIPQTCNFLQRKEKNDVWGRDIPTSELSGRSH